MVPGTVTQRVFLGEHWDYLFVPQQARAQLKVWAAPNAIFYAGTRVQLAVDSGLLVPIG